MDQPWMQGLVIPQETRESQKKNDLIPQNLSPEITMRSHKPNVVCIRMHLGKQLKMIKKNLKYQFIPKKMLPDYIKKLWEKARVGWFERIALKHVYYHMWNKSPVQVRCMRQGAWGWCTGMTLRDGMGREVGGEFRMGNTCKSCQCMAKTTTIL